VQPIERLGVTVGAERGTDVEELAGVNPGGFTEHFVSGGGRWPVLSCTVVEICALVEPLGQVIGKGPDERMRWETEFRASSAPVSGNAFQ